MNTKVFVLGLDGATWDLIKPWSEMGELPTFKMMIQNGVYGNLVSCIPPVTYPAWKCYSTGKNPGKLGVFSFVKFNPQTFKVKICNSIDFKAKEIWDYLGEKNIRVAIIDMPTTYPPKKVNGVMVSETPFPTSNFTYPKDFKEELDALGYIPFYEFDQLLYLAKDIQKVKETLSIIKSRFKVAEKLVDEGFDFINLTIFPIDAVQHYWWKSKETLMIWKYIDKLLCRLLIKISNKFNEKWIFFVISDHGMRSYNQTFYVNNWLHKHGYLVLRKKNKSALTTDIINFILRKYGLLGSLSRKIFLSFSGLRYILERIYRSFDLEEYVDFEKSNVIATASGIYLINIDQKEKLKHELIVKLNKLRGEYGKILEVFPKEKVCTGPFLKESPDIFIVPRKHYDIKSFGKDVIGRRHRWLATHKREGIFIAYGYCIRKGHVNISIYDLAPTILHIFDSAIPYDMDGRVLREIFTKASSFYKKEEVYQYGRREILRRYVNKIKENLRLRRKKLET